MTVYVSDTDFVLHHGNATDVLATMDAGTVHCCVTSPPYWGLRDYGHDGQIGLEQTPDEYVSRMVEVFREVRRVLRDDGTLWLNLGSSYMSQGGERSYGSYDGATGRGDAPERRAVRRDVQPRDMPCEGMAWFNYTSQLKAKDMVPIPWMVAMALQADGWWLRSDVIWAKPNPMPESVTDRPTKAHEYVFLLSKSASYFFDQEAVREPYHYDGRRVLERENGPGTHPQHRNGKRDRWPGIAQAQAQARRDVGEGGHDESEPMDIVHGGRNVRSVWEIATQPYAEAHFATFPLELPRRCIAAGSHVGGTVLDPFMGSGTTALVARNLGRNSVGIELNADYCELAAKRLAQQSLLAGDDVLSPNQEKVTSDR